jgi:hypothetical protein
VIGAFYGFFLLKFEPLTPRVEAPMAATPHISGRVNDRLYILAAILIPLIVLAGFARTYYLKGFFGTPDLPGRIVHLHGIIMTAWVVLFVAQISLVATRRTRIHQRLGILGALLAALVVVVGILTALYAAARGASPGPPALRFLVIPLGDMLISWKAVAMQTSQ